MTVNYDVFISFKNTEADGNQTRDSFLATEVYNYLSSRGLSVFLSAISLEALGVAAYKKAIDTALDSAHVLVAVGTSAAHLDAEWVRYEWDSFFSDTLSGHKKDGRIFVYLEGMTVADLPRTLRQSQAFLHGDSSLLTLYNFITHALTSSEADWLLRCQEEIARLNRPRLDDTKPGLPANMGGILAVSYICLIRHWNSGSLTIDPEAFRTDIESESGSGMADADWHTLTDLLVGLDQGGFGVLLRTPDPHKLVINYCALSQLWNSRGLGSSIGSTFGVNLSLKSPQDSKDLIWCDWLAKLPSQPEVGSAPAPKEQSSPEEVFPEAERARIQRDLQTLGVLPQAVRSELSKHLADRITRYKGALAKIKDKPGNLVANCYIGALFFWDSVRIVTAGTDDERRVNSSVQYKLPEGGVAAGYIAIAEYFLKKYLSQAPDDDQGRLLGNEVMSWIVAVNDAVSERRKAKTV
jgi:hypothetical protein